MEDDFGFDVDSFDEDDSLSPDELDYDGTDNWPLHADCKFNLDDNTGREVWVLTPRSLKNLSALRVVQTGELSSTRNDGQDIPAGLFQVLFTEACRIGSGKTVSYLVSTWPYKFLNLSDVEVPLDCYRGYFTRPMGGDHSLADMVIDGILHLQTTAKLCHLVLPESEAEGAAIVKKFLQLPLSTLKDVAHEELMAWLKHHITCTSLFSAVGNYLESVTLPRAAVENTLSMGGSTSEAAATGSSFTISLPGIFQWSGRSANHVDVAVGLALQMHTPFVFRFDKLAVCNSTDLRATHNILKLVAKPELVKKLVFRNTCLHANSDHIILKLAGLASALQGCTGLQAFVSKYDGMYLHAFPSSLDCRQPISKATAVFGTWRHLQELDLSSNSLSGQVAPLLGALETPLIRLNFSASELRKQDIQFLAQSCHAPALQYLNLDYNDLHGRREATKGLFQNLHAITALRTCCCRLVFSDAMDLSTALSHSHTLKTWNLLQNNLGSLHELKSFVRQCSKIPSLCEVGCKPLELHALFAGLYVHTDGQQDLTDRDRCEIGHLAESLNLMVF